MAATYEYEAVADDEVFIDVAQPYNSLERSDDGRDEGMILALLLGVSTSKRYATHTARRLCDLVRSASDSTTRSPFDVPGAVPTVVDGESKTTNTIGVFDTARRLDHDHGVRLKLRALAPSFVDIDLACSSSDRDLDVWVTASDDVDSTMRRARMLGPCIRARWVAHPSEEESDSRDVVVSKDPVGVVRDVRSVNVDTGDTACVTGYVYGTSGGAHDTFDVGAYTVQLRELVRRLSSSSDRRLRARVVIDDDRMLMAGPPSPRLECSALVLDDAIVSMGSGDDERTLEIRHASLGPDSVIKLDPDRPLTCPAFVYATSDVDDTNAAQHAYSRLWCLVRSMDSSSMRVVGPDISGGGVRRALPTIREALRVLSAYTGGVSRRIEMLGNAADVARTLRKSRWPLCEYARDEEAILRELTTFGFDTFVSSSRAVVETPSSVRRRSVPPLAKAPHQLSSSQSPFARLWMKKSTSETRAAVPRVRGRGRGRRRGGGGGVRGRDDHDDDGCFLGDIEKRCGDVVSWSAIGIADAAADVGDTTTPDVCDVRYAREFRGRLVRVGFVPRTVETTLRTGIHGDDEEGDISVSTLGFVATKLITADVTCVSSHRSLLSDASAVHEREEQERERERRALEWLPAGISESIERTEAVLLGKVDSEGRSTIGSADFFIRRGLTPWHLREALRGVRVDYVGPVDVSMQVKLAFHELEHAYNRHPRRRLERLPSEGEDIDAVHHTAQASSPSSPQFEHAREVLELLLNKLGSLAVLSAHDQDRIVTLVNTVHPRSDVVSDINAQLRAIGKMRAEIRQRAARAGVPQDAFVRRLNDRVRVMSVDRHNEQVAMTTAALLLVYCAGTRRPSLRVETVSAELVKSVFPVVLSSPQKRENAMDSRAVAVALRALVDEWSRTALSHVITRKSNDVGVISRRPAIRMGAPSPQSLVPGMRIAAFLPLLSPHKRSVTTTLQGRANIGVHRASSSSSTFQSSPPSSSSVLQPHIRLIASEEGAAAVPPTSAPLDVVLRFRDAHSTLFSGSDRVWDVIGTAATTGRDVSDVRSATTHMASLILEPLLLQRGGPRHNGRKKKREHDASTGSSLPSSLGVNVDDDPRDERFDVSTRTRILMRFIVTVLSPLVRVASDPLFFVKWRRRVSTTSVGSNDVDVALVSTIEAIATQSTHSAYAAWRDHVNAACIRVPELTAFVGNAACRDAPWVPDVLSYIIVASLHRIAVSSTAISGVPAVEIARLVVALVQCLAKREELVRGTVRMDVDRLIAAQRERGKRYQLQLYEAMTDEQRQYAQELKRNGGKLDVNQLERLLRSGNADADVEASSSPRRVRLGDAFVDMRLARPEDPDDDDEDDAVDA